MEEQSENYKILRRKQVKTCMSYEQARVFYMISREQATKTKSWIASKFKTFVLQTIPSGKFKKTTTEREKIFANHVSVSPFIKNI